MTSSDRKELIAWLESRYKDTPMPGAKRMFKLALDAIREQPANEPLTLDELRGMDGEPVWCEYINLQGARRDRKWCICHTIYGDIQPMDGYAEGGTDTSAICYGKTWLAYRRKPERSENDA